MTTTDESLAAVAKKYGVTNTASLDPYEEPYVDANALAVIDEWLRHVERSMATHRSPFIAAEILLKEIKEIAQKNPHRPERLYAATALPVLHHCLPHLTSEYRDIVSAAVHELIPAMAFSKAHTGSACAQPPTRIFYAECFWRVYSLFEKYRDIIELNERRARVEVAVMDRVVLSLDRLWVKMCFLSWKIHCRRIREKKLLFKKLAHRGMAGHIVPQYIRAWRQHAHAVMLAAKIARSSEVAKELEALYPQEQYAKSVHERTNEEVREKMRLLKEETARADQVCAKLNTMKMLCEETNKSLHEHWQTWHICMTAMFGDSHPINKNLEEDFTSNVTYQQNITDSAELYSKRARAHAGKVGLKQIQACLISQGYLGSGTASDPNAGEQKCRTEAPEPPLPLAPNSSTNGARPELASSTGTSGAPAPNPTKAVKPATHGRRLKYVKGPPPSTSVGTIIAAFREACSPVVSPLRLIDLLRGNQAYVNVALNFILCMYSGGHCSLFWPPLHLSPAVGARGSITSTTAPPDAAPISAFEASQSELCSTDTPEFRTSAVAGTSVKAVESRLTHLDQSHPSLIPPVPVDIRVQMLEDVDRGMRQATTISEGNDRYLLSVRGCKGSNSVDAIQEYLESVFARGSTMGLPLDRAKVEQALMPLVRLVDGPVIQALYPPGGISTFTEFSEYLTKIAEFSSIPLMNIAERLENGYAYSPRELMHYELNTSEDLRAVMREAHDYVTRLTNWLKDEAHPDLLNKQRTGNLLTIKLGLAAAQADEVWASAGAEKEMVSKDELNEVLYLASAFLDPSPFVSTAEKIAAVIDRCVPFLLDL